MKKVLILLGVILLAVVVYWLVVKKDRNTTEKVKPAPLSVSAQTDAFNTAFANLLNNYFELKDAFVDWDVSKVNKSATTLKGLADNLPVSQMKADSTLVTMADNYAKS